MAALPTETASVHKDGDWTMIAFVLPPNGMYLPVFAKIVDGELLEWTTTPPDGFVVRDANGNPC